MSKTTQEILAERMFNDDGAMFGDTLEAIAEVLDMAPDLTDRIGPILGFHVLQAANEIQLVAKGLRLGENG